MKESKDGYTDGLRDSSQNKVTERAEDLPEGQKSSNVDSPQELAVLMRTVISRTRVEEYSGPIPQAEQFEKYEKVFPGAAKEILDMAKEEQQIRKMRIGLERRRINAAVSVSFGMMNLAGIGIFPGISWTIVVPLGLSGMITFLLREFSKVLKSRP